MSIRNGAKGRQVHQTVLFYEKGDDVIAFTISTERDLSKTVESAFKRLFLEEV